MNAECIDHFQILFNILRDKRYVISLEKEKPKKKVEPFDDRMK